MNLNRDFQITIWIHYVLLIVPVDFNFTFHFDWRVLTNNRIAEIKSDYFCVLTDLQYLYLDRNQLTDDKFPNDALDCLANLYYL